MPNENNGKLQIKLGKSLIAVIGLIITVVLGYNQIRLGQEQKELQERLTHQQNTLQMIAIVKDYLPLMDDPGPRGQRALAIISAAANEMSTKYNDQFLANVAKAFLEGPRDTQDAVLQIKEATAPLQPTSKDLVFTVLATYERPEYARALAKTMSEVQKEYVVEVYRTTISNHYVVTIGGRRGRDEATQLAAIAREKGWSKDAFAQLDRSWKKVQ